MNLQQKQKTKKLLNTGGVILVLLAATLYLVFREDVIRVTGNVTLPTVEFLGMLFAGLLLAGFGAIDKIRHASPRIVGVDENTSHNGEVETFTGEGGLKFKVFYRGGLNAYGASVRGTQGITIVPELLLSQYNRNYVAETKFHKATLSELPPRIRQWAEQNGITGPYRIGYSPVRYTDTPDVEVRDGRDIKKAFTMLGAELESKNRLISSYERDLETDSERHTKSMNDVASALSNLQEFLNGGKK